jgi:hypothetical protein
MSCCSEGCFSLGVMLPAGLTTVRCAAGIARRLRTRIARSLPTGEER